MKVAVEDGEVEAPVPFSVIVGRDALLSFPSSFTFVSVAFFTVLSSLGRSLEYAAPKILREITISTVCVNRELNRLAAGSLFSNAAEDSNAVDCKLKDSFLLLFAMSNGFTNGDDEDSTSRMILNASPFVIVSEAV